jgi:hypothetical protein
MLDAYIIDDIRERRKERREEQVPLTAEISYEVPPHHIERMDEHREDDEPKRGVAIIDFSI